MRLAEVPGLGDIKAVLVQAARQGHVAHALLFEGQEGNAGLALALAFANYLNCENPGETDSCGVCSACAKFDKLAHPDLHLVFPVASTKKVSEKPVASHFLADFREFMAYKPFGRLTDWSAQFGAENKQLNISVEEARQIIARLSLKAFEGCYKIMLIWLPEMMNIQATNAILKILEEPTEDTVFLLVSNDPDRLLPTIISRCQKVRLNPYDNEEVSQFLIHRHQADARAAAQAAVMSDGILARALDFLEENTTDYFPLFSEWMRACFARKYADMVKMADGFTSLGREAQKNFMQYGLSLIREALVYRLAGEALVRLPSEEKTFVSKFAPFVTDTNASALARQLELAAFHIERNGSPKMIFVDTSLQLARLFAKRETAPVS